MIILKILEVNPFLIFSPISTKQHLIFIFMNNMTTVDSWIKQYQFMKKTLNVCVTGACGNLAYALYTLLCSGKAFGESIDLSLRLLDINEKSNRLKSLKIELEDCCFNNLKNISFYTK